MSESVVADFEARFAVDRAPAEPVRGRVLLSERRLVLAHGDGKVTVPVSNVFDVAVGDVPQAVSEFFDDTVTVGYRDDGDRRAVFIEAEKGAVDRFSRLLYKVILDGTTVAVAHPTRVGGRVTDADAVRARVRLRADGVTCHCEDGRVDVDLDEVVHFERERRTVDGTSRQVISLRHLDGGRTVTTELSLPSRDRLNVLGRYLRREYGDLIAEVRDVELSRDEKEVLVGIYSGGSGVDLAGLLGIEPGRLSMVLNRLVEKGLIVDGEETSLTATGRIAVSDRIKDVNI